MFTTLFKFDNSFKNLRIGFNVLFYRRLKID